MEEELTVLRQAVMGGREHQQPEHPLQWVPSPRGATAKPSAQSVRRRGGFSTLCARSQKHVGTWATDKVPGGDIGEEMTAVVSVRWSMDKTQAWTHRDTSSSLSEDRVRARRKHISNFHGQNESRQSSVCVCVYVGGRMGMWVCLTICLCICVPMCVCVCLHV